MTDGTARLRELARIGAAYIHDESMNGRWAIDANNPHKRGGNCPHPDCVLVREPADAPVGLRALVEQMRSDRSRWQAYGGSQDVVYASKVDEWADELDAALLRLGAETMTEPRSQNQSETGKQLTEPTGATESRDPEHADPAGEFLSQAVVVGGALHNPIRLTAHRSDSDLTVPADAPSTTPQERLSVADIDQIVEGIEHFIIGYPVDPEVRDIWRPYVHKLTALRADILQADPSTTERAEPKKNEVTPT